jgi:hypothetical protein
MKALTIEASKFMPNFDLTGYVLRDNDAPLVVNVESDFGPLIHRLGGHCSKRYPWLADCPPISEEEFMHFWESRVALWRLGIGTPVPGFCGLCVIIRVDGPTMAEQGDVS